MQSITIQISDMVKNHFNEITPHNNHTINQQAIAQSLQKIDRLSTTCNNESLRAHLMDLKDMIHMLNEPHWNLSPSKLARINTALSYFLNEHDIIPDSTPGVGYLDDCIVINNTKEYLAGELTNFLDFQDKQKIYGKNKCLSRQDWRKIKQQEANSRLRHRRAQNAMRNRRW